MKRQKSWKMMMTCLTSLVIVFMVFLTNTVAQTPQPRHRKPVSHQAEKALFAAIEQGNAVKVQALIQSGLDVNKTLHPQFRSTPLTHAAAEGQAEIVKLLLALGADLNQKGANEETALFDAVYKDHLEIVNILIAAKADVNAHGESFEGMTPLMLAAICRDVNLLKTLLKAGAKLLATQISPK